MEIEEIKNTILEKIEKIKLDRALLNNILLTIDNKDKNDNINDQLINHISNMEFDDDNVSEAIEYLTITITNMETQKINSTKRNTEELLKILEHILSTFKSIESCLHKLDIEKNKKNININSFSPNGKIASAVQWIIVLIIVLFAIYSLDNIFYNDLKITAAALAESRGVHANGK